MLVACLAILAGGCKRSGVPQSRVAEWAASFPQEQLSSDACAGCHEAAAEAWRHSQHAHANRPMDPAMDAFAFTGQGSSAGETGYTFIEDATGAAVIREARPGGPVLEHKPSMVIACDPLWQYLVELEPGRFQVNEMAWDPGRREWFPVFGSEERNAGEWGHWTGRGMNWNSMCARCHMTAYAKNYDADADVYSSQWTEQGIGCVQCHGAMAGHESGEPSRGEIENISGDPGRMMQTCAACHSRAEHLTPSFQPGDAYADHYRLQLPVDPRLYHPDGQILDEVFVFGSFRHSPMHAAGVTCLDCHEPHSGALRLPQENNAICMQCHEAPGRLNAPLINPTAHSFHGSDSPGNRCVECHMVETTYMQRDPRRDHGFIIPDPQLTKELGVPNACNRCHTDQSLDWALGHYEKWFGAKMADSRHRERARVVADAFDGKPDVIGRLLALIETEKVPAWRASLLALADQVAPAHTEILAAAKDLIGEGDPLVRAAAVRALANNPASRPALEAVLDDPARLVRLDAAWALSPVLPDGSVARREFDLYLNETRDQPGGLYRVAQDLFNRGKLQEAVDLVRKAVKWDPLSPVFPDGLGFMLSAQGRPAEAAQAFEQAAKLAPGEAHFAFNAALAWSEAGEMARSESMLGEALRRDRTLARAWYNLGLLQAQTQRLVEARTSLGEAERLSPREPDFAYALATVLARLDRMPEARLAAERALQVDPNYKPARDFLRAVESRP